MARIGRPRQSSVSARTSKKTKLTTSGWPAWDVQAEEFLDGIRHWVNKGGDDSFVAFHADFLSILDVFLDQLINWTEQTDAQELRRWAGQALAERLQFLKSQERDWRVRNSAFCATRTQFGDRRHSRSPRAYLGWLAGDYLSEVMNEKRIAPLFLRRPPIIGIGTKSAADRLELPNEDKRWLKRLSDLPNFSRDAASEWAEAVYEKMEQDEESILQSPEMQANRSRDSQRRHSGKLRLYDYKRTIIQAVIKQALKPVGSVRGVTRPS